MIFLKTPNLWGQPARVDGALGVVRGVENLSSQVVCLCMAVFVWNIFVYVWVRKKKKVRDKLKKRCVDFRTADCVCVCVCVCAWCVWSCLASTILMGPLRLLVELRPLFSSGDSRVAVVQALRHPLTDDVHQPLEGLLHVNVIFSARFKVLKTCEEGWQMQRERETMVTLIIQFIHFSHHVRTHQGFGKTGSSNLIKSDQICVSIFKWNLSWKSWNQRNAFQIELRLLSQMVWN